MWIFTQAGLVSIVEDMNNKNRLVVRARERKTLETLMPEYANIIQDTPSADYHFKLFIDRADVAYVVKKWVLAIDYTNFKGSIRDREYHDVLLSIWSMFRKYVLKNMYFDEDSEKKRRTIKKKVKQEKSK